MTLLRVNVWACVAIPILYFGLQAAFAPFYPGYSLWQTTASDLGAVDAPFGRLFSACILGLGVIMSIAAMTLPGRLRRLSVPLWLALLPALGVASGAISTFSAGLFPQPHPFHGGGPLGAGFLALPLLFAVAIWRPAGPRLRAYLAVNLVAFCGIATILAGLIPGGGPQTAGLAQKLLALTIFLPPAVSALGLARKTAAVDTKRERD